MLINCLLVCWGEQNHQKKPNCWKNFSNTSIYSLSAIASNKITASGWDFVMFDHNRPIGIHDRIFGEVPFSIGLDFVGKIACNRKPFAPDRAIVKSFFPLSFFSCHINLFSTTSTYSLPCQCISSHFQSLYWSYALCAICLPEN